MNLPMKVVYDSFNGRYGDNGKALYERLLPRSERDEHVWMCDSAHPEGFPLGVQTVPAGSAEAVTALESADLVIANTHIELDWVKKPGAIYLQTWHGTPLKRVHHDVRWAPPGRLDELDRDVARWDYLLSPNETSTPRLRRAFDFTGEVLTTGLPRNDLLSSPRAAAVRQRVRSALGLSDDVTAVLYTPTWRDDEFFAAGAPPLPLALDVDSFVAALGRDHVLLPRLHYFMTDRGAPTTDPGVLDVSRYPELSELYLAADVMITDYSSTMFDFAVTRKPLIFFSYDLLSYRDSLRGFYFELDQVAPGPLLDSTADVVAALQDLPGLVAAHAERYAHFRQLFNHLDDGQASDRVLTALGLRPRERGPLRQGARR